MSIAPCQICTGNAGIFTHFLTVGSSVTQVYPLGFMDTSLIDEVQDNDISYRRKFSGVLTFVNNNGDDDFDLCYAIEIANPCTKVIYTVKKDGVDYWAGFFSTTDGRFDLDKCTFEVTPLVDDDYSAILENIDIQYNILVVTPTVTTRTIYGTIFTRNRWFIDVIEYLADQVKTGVTVSSTFFTAATNPATLADNDLLLLTIAQKSDIIRPSSTNPATTAMMSWKELTEILWGMFQVTWDYDPATDTINVEHISWWSHSAGLDLRTQVISERSNKYSYAKEKMPKFEKFAFMEADSNFFVGVPIWYDSKCVNQDPDSNVVETRVNVTTDLEYIIDNPEAISDDGFVILCNYLDGGNYYVRLSVKLNMPLSWTTLHENYFRHNRVLIEGYLNSNLVTFWSAQKNKIQEINAIVCPSDNYDPNDEITTELGYTWFGDGTAPNNVPARVKTSELMPSGEMHFTLLYGPPDNVQTPIEEEKTVLIVTAPNSPDESTNLFTAYLSKNADMDIDILIRETIRNADTSVHCVGGWETWTILTGLNTDTFLLNQCALMQDVPGGSISFEFDVTGAGDWTVIY